MGTAIGLGPDKVVPFLSSLRSAGYDGDVVLFVDSGLERALRRLRWDAEVELIRARQWLPFKLGLLGRPRAMRFFWMPLQSTLFAGLKAIGALPLRGTLVRGAQDGLAKLIYTPMEARFVRYRRFLSRHPYARILLTDVRDVVFQNDPFAHLPAGGLAVSDETASYTLATEPHNAEWIFRAYGPAVLGRIGANRVSCVGVTYGDAEAISHYLDSFVDELAALPPKAAGIGGADTAIHNVLVCSGRLNPVHHLDPLASPVATLNGIGDGEIRLGPTGRLLNLDGSEVSVVHQYDRVRGLADKLLKSLAPPPGAEASRGR